MRDEPQVDLGWVLQGPIGEYVEAMGVTTEAPLEFHLFSLLAVLSTVFGRRSLPFGTRELRPTLYVVLMGDTAVTHKTTAASAAVSMMRRLDPDVRMIEGLGIEGGRPRFSASRWQPGVVADP